MQPENKHQLHEKRSREAGFSMIELIIAMTVFMVVTGSVYGLLKIAQESRGVVNTQVGLTKNVRVALNLAGRDTYNAGYGYPLKNTVILRDNRISTILGVPADTDTTRDTVPPIIAGNNITVNTLNPTPNTKTDQVTFLFKDPTFNVLAANDFSQPLYINAATTPTTGIDQIVPLSGSNASCRVNDLVLITGNNGASTLGVISALSGSNKVQFADGDVLGFNQTGSSGALSTLTAPGIMIRVKMVTYFVTADGILTRREFVNVPPALPAVGFVDEPLVYGVENFQIKYLMDDGSISDNPSAGADGIAGTADDDEATLAAIRQVRFSVDVRSPEKDRNGQQPTVTMTSTYSTRNLGYDAN